MLKLLKIRGDSLAPEFQNGDFVIISKIPFLFAPPSPGDIVAFQQPGYGLLIKRVQSVAPDGGMTVVGSHPDSIDSREFGPVNQSNISGKVIWHIRHS
jgi:phage repressor protein C with HTH and peptisase S24 domain